MDCTECRLPIIDDSILVLEGSKPFHSSCLVCFTCSSPLESSCFRGPHGRLYCRKDYAPLHSTPCRGCSKDIVESGIKIMPGVFYHPGCLRCFICETPLKESMGIHSTGDPLCPLHMNGRPISPDDYSGSSSSPYSSGDETEKKETEGSKRRGPRTTIKAPQLEKLQEIFVKNPKPSRAIRESLSKATGLPMRVIQVWFQNKRSKEKRLTSMKMYPAYGNQYYGGDYFRGYYSENLLPSPPKCSGESFVHHQPREYALPDNMTPPPENEWM